MKKIILRLLSFALVFTLLSPVIPANAAAAPKLNATKKTITGVGKTTTLSISNLPSKATVLWASSKKDIVSVKGTSTIGSSAVVTALKKGTATITGVVRQSGKVVKKLTCSVTVMVPSKGIRISKAKIDDVYNAHIIMMGTTYDFDRVLVSSSTKSTSTDKTYWLVEDPTIAKVMSTGVVTPLKEGSTYLVACAGKDKTEALDNYKNASKFDRIKIMITYPELKVNFNLKSSAQLELTFTQPMNQETLLTADKKLTDNLTITPQVVNNQAATSLDKLTGEFSEDGKVLTLTTNKKFDGTYEIRISDKILSKDGTPMKAMSYTPVLKDTQGPSYVTTTVDETGVIANIRFSEPINIDYLKPSKPVKNGASISYGLLTEKSSYKLSEDKQSLSIDLSSISGYNRQDSYSIDLYGIQDLTGNTSVPYPLVVPLYTDTTPKPQAVCTNVRRNGNALVATFNKAIQVPGYAVINGTYINGNVNINNKKEVVYSLTNSGLASLTGSVNVTLSGFSTYNAISSSTSTQYSTTISFSTAAQGPRVTERTLTTTTVNGAEKNALILTFDKEITLLSTSGTLSANSNINGIIGAPSQYAYTASASGKVVTVAFTSGRFTESGVYTFTLPAGFVMDYYSNFNTSTAVQVTKTIGTTNVLPAPSSIMRDSSDDKLIYITFDTMLDAQSAQDPGNYRISGLAISSVSLMINTPGSPAVVQIILAGDSRVSEGIPYPVSISNIKGYMDSYTVMDPYNEMIVLSNNRTLPLLNSYASSGSNTIAMTFQGNVSTNSTIAITFITQNGTTIIPDKITGQGSSTLTFTFPKGTLTNNMTITVSPTSKNIIRDISNSQMLNTPFSLIVQ